MVHRWYLIDEIDEIDEIESVFYVLGVTQDKAPALDIPDEPLKVKDYYGQQIM